MKYLQSQSQENKQKTNRYLILLVALLGFAFAAVAWLSVARYRAYTVGMFDLGDISQAIWSATHGRPLVYTDISGAVSRLSWHAEIIYFLLAPIYAIFPSPITLLVFQSALYAMGAVPAFLLAARRLDSRAGALIIAAIYLLYPVAQTAVLFDFHGDTLAMPFVLFAIEALDRRAWRSYAIWSSIALSCKLYVAVPIAVLGIVLWLKGERRVGVITIAASIIWIMMLLFLVRPLFTSPVSLQDGGTWAAYVGMYFGKLGAVYVSVVPRALTGLIVFGPAMLLGYRAWLWLLPGLAIAVPSLLSTGPGPSYLYAYHHYALVVPFASAAIVYGAGNFQRISKVGVREKISRGRSWKGDLVLTLIITILVGAIFVNTPLNPSFYSVPAGQRLESAGYGVTDRDRLKDAWLAANVPPGVPLAASTMLAAHLTDRETLYTAYYSQESFKRVSPQVEYFVLDAFFEAGFGSSMQVESETIGRLLQDPYFKLLQATDGLLLFGRNGDGLLQRAEYTRVPQDQEKIVDFDNGIRLVDFGVTPLGNGRYRFRYDWCKLDITDNLPPLFAVTRLEGSGQVQFVHLPTFAILPADSWIPGKVIREEFDVEFPASVTEGIYPVYVGWYDSTSQHAAESNGRSRIGREMEVGTLNFNSKLISSSESRGFSTPPSITK